MSNKPLRTVIIGFGKIGAGYADDPVMSRHYPIASHAQALAAHPAFAWEAVVDPSNSALDNARKRWSIQYAEKDIDSLAQRYAPEVAVIATPPQFRAGLIEKLPTLRAVLVEKPLGLTTQEGSTFLQECCRRQVMVQVNLWRRADTVFRMLASGGLVERIGRAQAVFGTYGNGLLNNGTHMIDFITMLLGEVSSVQAVSVNTPPYCAGPLDGDPQIPFVLYLKNGVVAMLQPLQFEHYRENSLDMWGERGRLQIAQEGLGVFLFPHCTNRAIQGEFEVACDRPQLLETTVGAALYEIYDNLANAIYNEVPLWSPGESALKAERAVEAIKESACRKGALIALESE
ncbi:MAG: Gfo/Idh/MocA family oxidoreductase [Nitrospirota bacterium]